MTYIFLFLCSISYLADIFHKQSETSVKMLPQISANNCENIISKDWTIIPLNTVEEPHWYREDIDLKSLDELLMELKIPLIANCRGFSDDHIKTHHLVDQMIDAAKKHKSIICLGLYYPGVPLPDVGLLEKINDAGFYAWINGNISDPDKKIDQIRSIKMVDHP